MSFNFDEKLRELKNEIKENTIITEKFKQIIEDYKRLGFEIQKVLEYASKYTKGDEKNKLTKLFREFSLKTSGELCEKLRDIGLGLKSNEKVYERFYDNDKKRPTGISYRIMELTRLGKREEVFLHY